MEITLSMLQDKDISEYAEDIFNKHFPEGGSYEDVLERCAEENDDVSAHWLLDAFGPTDDVFEVKGSMEVDSFYYPGSLKVGGSLTVKHDIRVGGAIDVDGDISVGGYLRSGLSVIARLGIQVKGINVGSNITAGGSIRSDWSISAIHDINAGLDIRSEISIESGHDITAGGSIAADYEITAGGSIAADCWIRSGRGIKADVIKSGDNYGIYAGLRLPLSEESAKVIAKTRPDNLITGVFVNKGSL